MHIDIDKRIASTINGLKEKYDLNLDEKEIIELIDTIKNELNFGNTELECEIVRMLMALHTIDEDENCSHFYTDVQEILDDLYMSEGHAPIKDADFKNALNALVLSGHIEESRKLHLKNSNKFSDRLLRLPIYPDLSISNVDKITNSIKQYFNE